MNLNIKSKSLINTFWFIIVQVGPFGFLIKYFFHSIFPLIMGHPEKHTTQFMKCILIETLNIIKHKRRKDLSVMKNRFTSV